MDFSYPVEPMCPTDIGFTATAAMSVQGARSIENSSEMEEGLSSLETVRVSMDD